jgi:hypothetical protein
MYETAIGDAEKAGDGGKARRCKRGLKVQKQFEYLLSIFISSRHH